MIPWTHLLEYCSGRDVDWMLMIRLLTPELRSLSEICGKLSKNPASLQKILLRPLQTYRLTFPGLASLSCLDQMGTLSEILPVSAKLKLYVGRAGKSTALSIIGGLAGSSGGTVTFAGGVRKPPRGTIGIVPQNNVLFPDLTCIQTLRVWKAIKWSANSDRHEDLQQLLRDCDLEAKIRSNANTLSGGQKRKLQLAIGLVSGSKSEPFYKFRQTD